MACGPITDAARLLRPNAVVIERTDGLNGAERQGSAPLTHGHP